MASNGDYDKDPTHTLVQGGAGSGSGAVLSTLLDSPSGAASGNNGVDAGGTSKPATETGAGTSSSRPAHIHVHGHSGTNANVHVAGTAHRPNLNDWKFPMTPRVSTPAPFEQSGGASSPLLGSQPQSSMTNMDYFSHPSTSYGQSSHMQQQQQSSFAAQVGHYRDGARTPRSPYLPSGPSADSHSTFEYASTHDTSAPVFVPPRYPQAQSVQRSSHSHSQSQESVGQVPLSQVPTTESHSSISLHMPAYQYHQTQQDTAQPGHSMATDHGPPAQQQGHSQHHQNPQLSLQQLPQGPAGPSQQLQTPSEFALKMLFTQFVKTAEAKLNSVISLPKHHDSEPDMLSPLKHGVDPIFDKLLASLGSVARHRPMPVIDCVMLWRKSKLESSDDFTAKSPSGEVSANLKHLDKKTLVERRSIVSLFIMSRSLIEIVSQVQKDTLPDDLGSRLEETVFNQLEKVDPEFIQRSQNRTANLNALIELMGSLSNVRFATVSDRFIAELEKYKTGAPVKDKDRELRMEMLIRGMRYLNLKLYPMDCLEETADFLQSCAGFFKLSRGIRIKHAYAELFVQLLTPVAKVALAEVNHPNWSKTVELIYPKARKMANKPRHVQVAFPLVTMLLCVSKKDFFLKHWISVFDSCREKFKDKTMRHVALTCASQLLWVYLFRCSDGTSGTFRTLDTIVKSLFPPSRKSSGIMEGSLNHYIRIVHLIGARHPDYACRSIIFSLLSVESLSNVMFTNMTLDMISPEKMTVALRAFMLILADLDKGSNNRPPFPTVADNLTFDTDSIPSSDILEANVINRAEMRDTYDQVIATLGKIAIVCDRNYGNTLVTDEKYTTPRSMFSAAAIMATATGDGGASAVHQYSTFAVSYSKEKQVYFDLMTAWVTCLPRCMPRGFPLVKVLGMLSGYTAHVDPELRKASASALVRIAKQCNSSATVDVYSRFVCTVEDRLDELLAGLSIPGSNIPQEQGLLGIYIQILEAWIQDTSKSDLEAQRIQRLQEQSTGTNEDQNQSTLVSSSSPITSADGSRSLTYIPDVSLSSQLQTTEVNGLLFLCNISHTIRRYAITILKLAASIETPETSRFSGAESRESMIQLGGSNRTRFEAYRIFHILQNAVQELLMVDEYGNAQKDCPLALQELIRLQIHHQKGPSEVFSLLAGSDHKTDVGIWRQCFPLLITKIFHHFPDLCESCLDTVGKRLMQYYPAIMTTTDLALNSTLASRFTIKTTQVATDDMVEQWRMYLIFVCSTMVRQEHQSPATRGHGRKKSAPSENITCARDLFRLILPLLYSDRGIIRESVVYALGRINVHLYKALLEDIQAFNSNDHDEFRTKSNTIKPNYQGKRNKRADRLRAEIAHVLALTGPLLKNPALAHDDHITAALKLYIRETLIFLLDAEVQHDWDFVNLRTHFCGFVCHFYNGISQIDNTDAIMTFELRLALFRVFEEWYGHRQHTSSARDMEGYNPGGKIFWFGLDTTNEAQMEEKSALELAALRAMASLCQGPISNPTPVQRPDRNRTNFEPDEMFSWIESVFRSPDDRYRAIAQSALDALLIHNQDKKKLLDVALHRCYTGDMSKKFIQGHFSAIVDIYLRVPSYPCSTHEMLSLALFMCGDPRILIRTLAIKLLKAVEAQYFPEPCAGEYEIGIVNKLPTIYRQAQYVLSARLAQERPELTYSFLSEAMMRFDDVKCSWRGEMLYYMAPWVGNVELVFESEDDLAPTSCEILTNLFYLTVKYGDEYVKEIEHLWVQLVAGDNFANIQPIIIFLLDLGLEKRNPGFVHAAKKVIVFLGRTSARSQMVDILIGEISPKAMVPKLKQERTEVKPPPENNRYIANLDSLINGSEKRPAFSRGQLATVLLVDLAVEAGAELRRFLPLLLQALFVQLDHYTALICDQTRSLLVHLIHSIIIRESGTMEVFNQATDLVEFLNTKEGKPLWAYDDIISLNKRESPELESLVFRTLHVFQVSEAEIRQQWGETALQWATACPVRHIACRSFQIFRALAPGFSQSMLADMLARLSNTIADKSQEIQAFAMEILISLQSVIDVFDTAQMKQFPQIFWGSIACLYTGHDQEYLEGLKILEAVTNRLDLLDIGTLEPLLSSFPQHWDSSFMGIQPLLLKGLRSTTTEQLSLRLLRKTMFVSEVLIDDSDSRVVFLFYGVLPILAHGLENNDVNEDCLQWARDIAAIADRNGFSNISHLLGLYMKMRFRTQEDFWRQIAILLRDLFVPDLQAETVVFFMRLLYNSNSMYKHKALRCLKLLLPLVDTTRTELLEIGPELVMPLLRLLLQADFASEALEVLDATMNLSEQSAEIFKIRVPLDAQSPGLNFEDMTKGILGGGTGLERRPLADHQYLLPQQPGQQQIQQGLMLSPSLGSLASAMAPQATATSTASTSEPKREHFWQTTRANVNAVMLTCTDTGYWRAGVELLAEHEMNTGYPVDGQYHLHHPIPDIGFVDQDNSMLGMDQGFGSVYSLHDRREDMNGNEGQYGQLVSALDDLTEHFADSAQIGGKRESVGGLGLSHVYLNPSFQSQWSDHPDYSLEDQGHYMNAYGGRPIEGLGLDPALMEMSNKDEGQLHHQQQQQQIHGQGDSLPQHLSQSQHHRRSRHGSKGSRDEFGFYSMAHHDRIAEDEEEESSTMLMAAEILNKSLSINRSYSSIRSSFLLEPSASFATPELENEAGPKAGMPPRLGSPVPGIDNSTLSSGAGPGATIASGTTAVEAAIPGDRAPSSTGGNSGFGGNNGRIRLFAPGQGHRVQRSSGGGSGSGSGSSSTMSMGGGSNSHLLTRSTSGGGSNGPSANGHRRTGSSNAGSNSSSIAMSTPGYSGPMSNRGAGSSVGRGMIGHQIQASCEDLLLSPSDNEDDDDYDDDSTESEDEDYDTNPYLIQHAPVSVNQYPHHYPHHYQPQQQQQLPYSSGRYEGTKTRENSFEYRHVAGSGMHPTGRTSLDGMMGGAAGGVGTSGRFMGGYQSPVDSQPTSRPSSRPNSRAGSRPGSMPTSPSSKRLAHERGPGGLGRHGSIPPGAV